MAFSEYTYEIHLAHMIQQPLSKLQIGISTGKKISEAPILASTNPQYDKRFPLN